MATITYSSWFHPLSPMREWLDRIQFHAPWHAHLICKLIPHSCPFERNITVLGQPLVYIPPLCKFNPFYNEFVSLRLRALTFLADDCATDITPYLQS